LGEQFSGRLSLLLAGAFGGITAILSLTMLFGPWLRENLISEKKLL
jgi:hypothetical protein